MVNNMENLLNMYFNTNTGLSFILNIVITIQVLLWVICIVEDLRNQRFPAEHGMITRDRMLWSVERIFFALFFEMLIVVGILYSLLVDSHAFETIRMNAPASLVIEAVIFVLWAFCILRYFTVEHFAKLFMQHDEYVPGSKKKNIKEHGEGLKIIRRYVDDNQTKFSVDEKSYIPCINVKAMNYSDIKLVIDVVKKIEYEMKKACSTLPFYVIIENESCGLNERFAVYPDNRGYYSDKLYLLYYRYYLQLSLINENSQVEEYANICRNPLVISCLMECDRRKISVMKLSPIHFL